MSAADRSEHENDDKEDHREDHRENQDHNQNQDQDQNHNQDRDQIQPRQAERESADRFTNLNTNTTTPTGVKRRRTGSIGTTGPGREPASASALLSASASTPNDRVSGTGGKNKPGVSGNTSGSTSARGKKPREQFSCVECFR